MRKPMVWKMSKENFELTDWSNYDYRIGLCHIANYGCVYVDEYCCPIDDEYLLEEVETGNVEVKFAD